ncbi:MAG: hypothetical protein ABSA32_08425 [Candidatus Acidiferrales bacterium]|jgi:hypothetical protein
MHISPLSYAIWIAGTLLEILVCALAYWRGLHRTLPFFTAYLTAHVVKTGIQWVIYQQFGFGSWAAYDASWISNAVTMVAQALLIGELCHRLLRAYPGVWALAWRALLFVSAAFMLNAAIESASHAYWLDTFVLALDRDLRLAAIAVLITLLLIGRYYELELDRLERRIAAGLCLYAVVDMITSAVMVHTVATHLPGWIGYQAWAQQSQAWWNVARALPSVGILSVWAVTLAQPIPATRPAPALLPASAYRELAPAVNLRLRAFNARLLELLKP